MVNALQALQIALDYLWTGETALSAEEELLRSPDEYHITLYPETFWKFDVRGHDIWTIAHQTKLAYETSEHPEIIFVDSVTGQVWMLGETRPPASK